MATEEPQSQSLAAQPKVASPGTEDKMVVDEPSASSANGHAKSEEPETHANGHAEDTAATADKEALNQKAVDANSTLLDQSSPKSKTENPTEAKEDTEMKDDAGPENPKPVPDASPANDVEKDQDTKASDSQKEEPDQSLPQKSEESPARKSAEPVENQTEPDAQEPKSAESSEKQRAEDSMDLDDTAAHPDPTSDADHGKAGTNGLESNDAAPVTSPKAPLQAPAGTSDSDKITSDKADDAQPDVAMDDPPSSPRKVSREREDDSIEEPAAKRPKTESTTEEKAVDPADSSIVASGPPTSAPLSDIAFEKRPINLFQNRQLRNMLASVKKTKAGGNFRQSVERLWPALWDDYKAKIKSPVDITTLEVKLRNDTYANYSEIQADVNLMVANCETFNGLEHDITKSSKTVRDQIFSKLPDISLMEEPTKPEKGKSQATRHAEPRAATQPRRQSQSQAPRPPAPTPKEKASSSTAPTTPASATAPAFAIPPNANGVPTIRRDSTREGGDRPKRPIHPPKNRDLEYTKTSRKKKLEPEQRFMLEVMTEIMKPKYGPKNLWFTEPVDPVALNIPHYFNVIKRPMDFKTMLSKVDNNEYRSTKDLEKDMTQIVTNAKLFNGANHEVSNAAVEMEDHFKAEMKKKDSWMEKNKPREQESTRHASPDSFERSGHESEDESEGEEQETDNDAIRNLQSRLNEEQDKLNAQLNSKKPDLTMIEVQQNMVSIIQRKLVEEKTKFAKEKKPKPKKKPTKSKPKTSASTASGGNSKKAAPKDVSNPKKSTNGGKRPAPKKKTIGALEKAVIGEGIGELEGPVLDKAVLIIKRDTGQNENDDGEMELDLESLSTDALVRLYELINKARPQTRANLEKQPEFANRAKSPAAEPKSKSNGAKSKKNKPMNKHEQERRIEQLRELKTQLQRGGSGSQEPLPGSEENQGAETSEEESDSEEE